MEAKRWPIRQPGHRVYLSTLLHIHTPPSKNQPPVCVLNRPPGFLDRYDPDHICNGSDDGGRYDYKGQPEICRYVRHNLLQRVGELRDTRGAAAGHHGGHASELGGR